MRPYFEKMPGFGKALKENRIARTQESRAKLEAVEAEIAAAKQGGGGGRASPRPRSTSAAR